MKVHIFSVQKYVDILYNLTKIGKDNTMGFPETTCVHCALCSLSK